MHLALIEDLAAQALRQECHVFAHSDGRLLKKGSVETP